MRKLTILVALFCIVTFAQQGKFTDARDGKVYNYVNIGFQSWMAENLKYETSGSVCYNNQVTNCEKYGRLYNWATAMTVCPSGWHLPSNAEWNVLHHYLGGLNDLTVNNLAGKLLKAANGWNSDGNGEDKYGFAALPGGSGDTDGKFSGIGDFGIWWTAGYSHDGIWWATGYSHESTNWVNSNRSNLYSVRCVIGEIKEQKKIEENKDNYKFSDYTLYDDNPKNTQENIEKETNVSKREEGLEFGIRAGFGLYRVSTEGCTSLFCSGSGLDSGYSGRSIGYGFGGGLVIKNLFVLENIPYINASPLVEFNLSYRNSFNLKTEGKSEQEPYKVNLTELAISIPITARIEISERTKFWHYLNFFTGFQLDIPIQLSKDEIGEPKNPAEKFNGRASIDYGYLAGFGYDITESIAVDMRIVGGLADFSKGEKRLVQASFGLSIFF